MLKDYLALTKPGVTRMCLLMALGGMLLAPAEIGWVQGIAAMIGIGLCVAGSNALNMWLERLADARMRRTCRRPLPAGRMRPASALHFGLALSVAGVATLAAGTNLLTAALTGFAVAAYVLVYTPLKYRTPLSLVIGAVPGAIPPLVGWTAATGSIDPPAIVLFGLLLVWQIPHFLAIALYRADDYERAGIRVVPVVRGPAIAKIQAVAWSMLLIPLSLLLVPMGIGGGWYFAVATVLGTAYLAWGFTGLDNRAGTRWARGYFFASLVYLPALTLALVIDHVV